MRDALRLLRSPPPLKAERCMRLTARSGYLPPCGGGRFARFAREPGGGYGVHGIKFTHPSPSRPHRGGGSRLRAVRSEIRSRSQANTAANAARTASGERGLLVA